MDPEDAVISRALKVTVELVLKRVSWVGIRLEPSNRLQIRVCLFGFHLHTRHLPTGFPVQVRERLIFERTFPLCTRPSHVFSNLDSDHFALDLIEISGDDSGTLATFKLDINELLFGDPPHMHADQSRTNYYDFNLENTSHFPFQKHLHPVLSATVKVAMATVQDPVKESKSDGAFNLTLGYSGTPQHPAADYEKAPSRKSKFLTHLTRQEVPRRLCQRVILKATAKKEESPTRPPFIVRHVDEKLIGRTPGWGEGESVLEEKAADVGYLHARRTLVDRNSCTSQRDTVASSLRRRPKIHRSATDLRNDTVRPRDDLWCREQSTGWDVRNVGTSKNLGRKWASSDDAGNAGYEISSRILPTGRKLSTGSDAGTTNYGISGPNLLNGRKSSARGDIGNTGYGISRPISHSNEKWSASDYALRKPTEEWEPRRPSTSSSEFTSTGSVNCACCYKHHNQTCTVCKLYQQYFGESYPNHSL